MVVINNLKLGGKTMKRKQDFQEVNRLMKSKNNVKSGRLVCVASIYHGSILRIPYEDYKDDKGNLQKGAVSLVWENIGTKEKPSYKKSKEWYFCPKEVYKRYIKGENVSFGVYENNKLVGLKNVILN